ncbi:uncharacterized protein K02A2.6-like [Armigeres subalbatus]|uniref:uncharacterized protein K02A2.6-like n=1 Tax=Armigeres subalbatus TaxID=124917 RepID=UPI002ED09354
MALMLLMYDFTIEYVGAEKFAQDYVIAAVSLEDNVRSPAFETFKVLPLSFNQIQKGTEKDLVLSKAYDSIQQGWMKASSSTADRELQKLYNRREFFTTVEGCILSSDRLVIPRHLRKRCLAQLHQGHPGIHRMKPIARSCVYWPSIDIDIVKYVKPCASIPWPKLQRPWQRVHVDYAEPLDGEYYLLVVDSFSKWPKTLQTSRITVVATIKILQSIFARLGMPETVV